MSFSLERLERQLGYTFKDQELMVLALTHRSFAGRNNERLEFLGDAILNFVAGEALFDRFPLAREGQLSRLRARLVKAKPWRYWHAALSWASTCVWARAS